ncbi:hypothetical protein [Nocardia asiatica]|uniref:hypothetical protein n=1 Tax=Nocardia asiatica TaxID=209252 RepID=UPI002455668F|nr:hypothetical protein [Nocardia asiatica]
MAVRDQAQEKDLAGKTVVVTGASSGIGAAAGGEQAARGAPGAGGGGTPARPGPTGRCGRA